MLTIPHTLAGAAIGSVLQQVPGGAPLAFGLGWASHYVFDSLPHWERFYKPHREIDFETDDPVKEWPKDIFIQAVIDVVVAWSIIGLILAAHTTGPWYSSPLFWGALGGFAPDLLDNLPYWNRFLERIWPFSVMRRFHVRVHISSVAQKNAPKYAGLISQLIVILLSLLIIF